MTWVVSITRNDGRMRIHKGQPDLVSASFLRDVVLVAAAKGADVGSMLVRAGLTRSELAAPDALIPGRAAERLWEAAVEMSGDPNLGLAVGAAAHPSALGVLGPVLLHSADLRSALCRFADYSRLVVGAFTVAVELPQGPTTAVSIALASGDSYVRRAPRQPIECTLAAIATVLNALAGRRVEILRVELRHPAPRARKSHTDFFGAPVHFEREWDRIVVPTAVLDWPVLLSDEKALIRHESVVRESMRRSTGEHSTSDRVRTTLATLTRGRAPSIADVAARFGCSQRSLQRALESEGTSFRAVLDEVRAEMATALLADASISIAEVALLLGFSDARAFHRSFKRWTGATPRGLGGP